jgi:hypothetical protein
MRDLSLTLLALAALALFAWLYAAATTIHL